MSDSEKENPQNRTENRKKHTLPEAARPFMFQPGKSGNPGGRPKKRLLDEVLEELLEAAESGDAVAIAKALIKKAKKGDSKSAQLIAERTQGKPKQQVTFDGNINISAEERAQRVAEIIARRVGAEI